MRENYLGTDILFDEEGVLAVSRMGDLFAHPDWGCGIGRLLGAMDTPLNRALATRYIRHALEADPRVEDNTITITPLIFTPEEKRFDIRITPVRAASPEVLVWGFGLTNHKGTKTPSI